MKKTFSLAAAAIAILASSVSLGAHANDTIKGVNNKVSLSFATGTGFDYKKTDSDGLTSGERNGSQNGFTLAASTQTDAFGLQDVYLGADVSYMNGDTKYNGFVFDGSSWVSATGKTDYNSIDFAMKLGKGFKVASGAQVTPYLTVGTRKWDRDSLNQGGYLEKHRNSFYGVGAMFQYAIAPSVVLTLDGSFSQNTNSEVNWVDGGTKYSMDNKGTTQLGVGVNYRVTPQLSVFADYRMVQTKFGASGMIDGYIEPANKAKTQRVNVGVAYHF